jgi:hypothetical protein
MMRVISSRKRVCCPMPGNGTAYRAYAAPVLEADDGLAAEAATAKPFEYLTRAVQFNR